MDPDGVWPATPVRDAIEALASSAVEDGFKAGVYNGRGVTKREYLEGGEPEFILAEKYAAWATAVADKWPRTAAVL